MSSADNKTCRLTTDGVTECDVLKSEGRHLGCLRLFSILAKALFACELTKRYPQFTTSSLHPGTVRTNVWYGGQSLNPLLTLALKPIVWLAGVRFS